MRPAPGSAAAPYQPLDSSSIPLTSAVYILREDIIQQPKLVWQVVRKTKRGEFLALLQTYFIAFEVLRRRQVFGFEHVPNRCADVLFKTLAEMVTADRQIDDIGEVSRTAEERPEKELPVVAASFLDDTHIPHRAEEAAHLIEMGTPLYLQLWRVVFFDEGRNAFIILFGRVDVL